MAIAFVDSVQVLTEAGDWKAVADLTLRDAVACLTVTDTPTGMSAGTASKQEDGAEPAASTDKLDAATVEHQSSDASAPRRQPMFCRVQELRSCTSSYTSYFTVGGADLGYSTSNAEPHVLDESTGCLVAVSQYRAMPKQGKIWNEALGLMPAHHAVMRSHKWWDRLYELTLDTSAMTSWVLLLVRRAPESEYDDPTGLYLFAVHRVDAVGHC